MTNEVRADPGLAAALAQSLRAAGFDRSTPQRLFADGEAGARERASQLPPGLATLAQLFLVGDAVARADAEGVVDVAGAHALGVVAPDGGVVRPLVRIVPHDILFLASDLPAAQPAADHVAAADAPSHVLARLTVRRHVDRALDLGTGNGIQALVLALHAKHVVATDVNERALAFTNLNAALNGRTNIETRRASFFDELPDERFGAIVCNPPFVISPETRLLYRDAPVRGDQVGAHLLRHLPGLLADDGFATVLTSWVDDDSPLSWVDGGSALALRLRVEAAEASADYWTDDPGVRERWIGYYRREGIERISYGAVLLHRGAGSWRETLELPGGPAGQAGEHLERLFRENEQGRAVAGERFAWARGVAIAEGEVEMHGGLGFRAGLEGDALEAAEGAGAGEPVPLAAVPLVEQLLRLGFLVPARP